MNLAIGTAQFGSNYGVSNQTGQISRREIKKILKGALRKGIYTLDTASAYGSSEQILGILGIKSFDVISKLERLPTDVKDTRKWIFEQILGSLTKLNVSSLCGYLLHYPQDLLGPDGDLLFETLFEAKAQGLIEKIGISIYDPRELDLLIGKYEFNIVQAPMNVFDRRIAESGWLDRLKNLGIEVHIRSVFLQGLLLMNASARPNFVRQWGDLFDVYDKWLRASSLTALQACIGTIKQFDGISKIIVGVSSLQEFEDIAETTANTAVTNSPRYLISDDKDLINPSRWSFDY